MIGVKRGPVPAVLDPLTSTAAANELKRNRAEAKKANPAFKFDVYKNRDVLAALEKMFQGRCAYCESNYAPVHPTDVEHYRPKSEVRRGRGEKKELGYWWLAASWDNLLASCIDCNRARKHVFDANNPNGAGTHMRGKENLFPVAVACTANKCTHVETCHLHEVPLLLNPCDDPEKDVEFDEKGVVVAKTAAAAARVAASVDVYGLDRPALLAQRLQFATDILNAIELLGYAEKRVQADPSKQHIREAMLQIDALKAMWDGKKGFAGLARTLIRKHLGREL